MLCSELTAQPCTNEPRCVAAGEMPKKGPIHVAGPRKALDTTVLRTIPAVEYVVEQGGCMGLRDGVRVRAVSATEAATGQSERQPAHVRAVIATGDVDSALGIACAEVDEGAAATARRLKCLMEQVRSLPWRHRLVQVRVILKDGAPLVGASGNERKGMPMAQQQPELKRAHPPWPAVGGAEKVIYHRFGGVVVGGRDSRHVLRHESTRGDRREDGLVAGARHVATDDGRQIRILRRCLCWPLNFLQRANGLIRAWPFVGFRTTLEDLFFPFVGFRDIDCHRRWIGCPIVDVQ